MRFIRLQSVVVLALVLLFTACTKDPPVTDTAKTTVTSVSIKNKPGSMRVSDAAMTLLAEVQGTNNPAQSVNWSSSDGAVASVSSSGELRALKAGKTSITATSTADNTKKDSFDLTVTPASTPTGPTLKINLLDGTRTTEGGATIVLSVVKSEVSESVNWSLSGTPLGSLSSTTGDSVTYTPPATGSGSNTITATAGDLNASVTITISPASAPSEVNRIVGEIEDWTKTGTVLFNAITDQNEILATDRVSSNGKLDMTLNTPQNLADLDGSFDAGVCSANNELRSEPAFLKGAVVYELSGTLESSSNLMAQAVPATPLSTVIVTQRSFVAGSQPLNGQGFVFRVYSETDGDITGSCQSSATGLRLEFNVSLSEGWNLVEAIYNQGNREFNVRAATTLNSGMKLEAETYDPPPAPVNEAPYPYLDAYVGPGFNEVLIDAYPSYDIDGSITYWELNMGDGTVYTSSTYGSISSIYGFSHVYGSSGLYTVTLTVYDNEGASATATDIGDAY
jgi:hypothetical protein